jgi:hypothetical protein
VKLSGMPSAARQTAASSQFLEEVDDIGGFAQRKKREHEDKKDSMKEEWHH